MKKLWTITLPRFRCPHCGKTINNVKFKGRMQTQKRGKIIDRGDSLSDVDEKDLPAIFGYYS
jgi:hypothetical protein